MKSRTFILPGFVIALAVATLLLNDLFEAPTKQSRETASLLSASDDLADTKALITFPNGSIFSADIADTNVKRAQGLSYRPYPQFMLFVFDAPGQPSFWMKDMNFAIDIIWLMDGTIIGYEQNAIPEYPAKTFYTPNEPVDMVLEVPAGEVEVNGLRVGDQLDITFKQQ